MKNVLVVSNFKAGRKTAIKYKKNVLKFLLKKNVQFKFVDICEFENFDVSKFDTIIAMGGDGTVNKVIPYIINSDKTLGIIPCGTANLLAAKLKIPTDVKKALKIINKNRIRKIDSFEVNQKACILRFGLGYDSDIICKTPQSIKNRFGYFSYFVAGILFALRLKKEKYTISFDNQSLEVKASCIIVANAANMYKNVVSIGNKAKLNDGLLDVFILKTSNPVRFFIEFIKILLKCKSDNSRALYFKTSKLTIKNNRRLSHIDGEKCKIQGDIEINILPKSVNVFGKRKVSKNLDI